MRTTFLTLVLSTAATFAACKKKEDEKKPDPPPVKKIDAGTTGTGAGTGTGTGTGTGAGTATGTDAGTGGGEAMAKKAGNCPSTVVGATTTIDEAVKDKVVVSITAKEEGAVPTIRARTKHLVDVQNAPETEVKHTGEGMGGGERGVCPVIPRNNKLEAEDIEGGVKVTMTPAGDKVDQAAVDALRAEVTERIAAAKQWTDENIKQSGEHGNLGGDGGGKGGHGMNRTGKGNASGPRDKPAEPAGDDKDPAAGGDEKPE